MTKAAGYIRVSEARDGMISPSIQRDEIARYAAGHDLDVTRWFEDIDITGRTDTRPGLQALLAAAHDIDAVIVYRLDRFTREPLHYYQMVHALTAAGVALHDAGESRHEASPETDFMRGIRVLVAKQESANIGRRAEATHRRLAKTGRWAGGPVPYGWRRVRDENGPRLEVDEEEAKWRRWMHAQYWQGASCHGIARDLNAQGVRPRRAAWWTNGIVRAILLAPVQIGARTSDGELVRGGNIEPLMSEEDYARTVALVPARSRRRGRLSPLPLPTTLMRCGTCGGPMRMNTIRSLSVYVCRATGYGIPCGYGVSITAAKANEAVEAAVLARVRRMRPGKPRERPATPTRAHEARLTLARARDAVARLSVMYASGDIGEREYQDARRLARERVEQAEAALTASEQATEAAVARDALTALWADLRRVTPEAWAALSVPVRRQIIGLLVESVTVLPGRAPAVERCQIAWCRLG